MRAEEVLGAIYSEYWHGYAGFVIQTRVKRLAYQYALCKRLAPNAKTICDIGGQWGDFAALCSTMGLQATLVDDFRDPGCSDEADGRRNLPRAYGVRVLQQDVLAEDFFLEPGQYDIITCFGCLEHLHNSPKKFLHTSMDALKPGGLMVLSAPNCANLMKRIRGIAGTNSWSAMDDWYEKPIFRGHVREPSVSDLYRIGRDLDLKAQQIWGCNWLGMGKDARAVRLLATLFDAILRLRPSLCSNLYLTGFKNSTPIL